MNNEGILLEECNVISLRTAVVIEEGRLVGFHLRPAPSSIPTRRLNVYKDEFIEWLDSCMTFLYQHPPSTSGEEGVVSGIVRVEPHVDIRLLAFEKPPELKLLWADSGNSAAVYLNGEPWAFIDEETHKAYSKGVLSSIVGNPWDQEVFEKTFGKGVKP